MQYAPKVVGAPCNNGCGGKYVFNQKTGKTFCENKCWLKDAPQQAPLPQAQACNCEENWQKLRLYTAKLETRVKNLETFQEGQNPTAREFHSSFTASDAANILSGQIDPTQ